MKTTAVRAEPRELLLVRHRGQPRVALAPLRALICRFLNRLKISRYRLGIHLVGARRIAQLNEGFLHHAGLTDVIAFDYRPEAPDLGLHGEVFVCVPEVARQARRYRATAAEELVRTVVHGVLHLQGYRDDSQPQRRLMKAAENRWVRTLRADPDLDHILPND